MRGRKVKFVVDFEGVGKFYTGVNKKDSEQKTMHKKE